MFNVKTRIKVIKKTIIRGPKLGPIIIPIGAAGVITKVHRRAEGKEQRYTVWLDIEISKSNGFMLRESALVKDENWARITSDIYKTLIERQ